MKFRKKWKRIISSIMLPLLISSLIPTFNFTSKAAGASVTVEKDGKTFAFAMADPADFSLEGYNIGVEYSAIEESGYAYAEDYPGYQWVWFQLKPGTDSMELESDQPYTLNVTMPGNIDAVGKMTFYRDTTDEDRAQGVQTWYVSEDTVATANGKVLSIPVKKFNMGNNITVFGAVKVSETDEPEPDEPEPESEYEDGLYTIGNRYWMPGEEVPMDKLQKSTVVTQQVQAVGNGFFFEVKDGEAHQILADDIDKFYFTDTQDNVVTSGLTMYFAEATGYYGEGYTFACYNVSGTFRLHYEDSYITIQVNDPTLAVYENTPERRMLSSWPQFNSSLHSFLINQNESIYVDPLDGKEYKKASSNVQYATCEESCGSIDEALGKAHPSYATVAINGTSGYKLNIDMSQVDISSGRDPYFYLYVNYTDNTYVKEGEEWVLSSSQNVFKSFAFRIGSSVLKNGLYVDGIRLDEEIGLEVPKSDNPISSFNLSLKNYTQRSLFYIKKGKTYYVPKDEINKLVVTKDGNVVSSSDYRITNYVPYNMETHEQDGPLTDGLFGFYFYKEGNYTLTYTDADNEEFSMPLNVYLADVAVYTDSSASADTLAGTSVVQYTRNKNVFYVIATENRMTDDFSKYDCEIKNLQASEPDNCTIEEITSGKVYKITVNSGERTEIEYTCVRHNYTRESVSDVWEEREQSEDSKGCSFILKQDRSDFVIGSVAKDESDNPVFRYDTKLYGTKYLTTGINQISPIQVCLGIRINDDDVEPVTEDFTVIAQDEAGYDTDDFELSPMDGVPGVWEMRFKKLGKYKIQAIIDGSSKYVNIEVSLPQVAIYNASEATSDSLIGEQAAIEGGEVFYINAVDSYMEAASQGMEVEVNSITVTPSSASKYVTSELISDKQLKLTIADNCNTSFDVKVAGQYRNYVMISGQKTYGRWFSKDYTLHFENKVFESPAVVAKTTKNGVQLTWNASDGATAYRVFRKTEDGTWKTLGDTANLEFEDKKGVAGTTYYYAVRCINASGKKYTSPLDKTKLASIIYPVGELVSPKPVLTALNGEVVIDWTAVTGSPNYRIFRQAEGGSWKKLADVSATSYSDTTGVGGTNYTYAIRCLSSDGKLLSPLDKTKLASITYPAGELVSPKPALASVTDGIKISWAAVTGSPKYRIFRKVEGGTWKKLTDVSTTTFTDTTGTAGKTYSYAIRCLDADGTTLLSKFDSKKTAEMVFPSKSIVSPKPTLTAMDNGVFISWTVVPGVAKYKVYKKTGTGSWKVLTDSEGTAYTDTKCTAGKEYSYAVRCMDENGKLISKFDNNAVSVIVK